MKQKFSTKWKASKQPRKKRKYIANAPLHIKGKFLSTNLSKELREKHKKRNLRIRKGDKVKILRGNFKKHMGKVEKVFTKITKVFVEGAEIIKKDGSKTFYPIHPSNLMITELNMEDKKRQKSIKKNDQITLKKD